MLFVWLVSLRCSFVGSSHALWWRAVRGRCRSVGFLHAKWIFDEWRSKSPLRHQQVWSFSVSREPRPATFAYVLASHTIICLTHFD